MQTIKYDATVHKAGLPLQDGESLRDYTDALRKSITEHVMKKLNLTLNKASVYMVQVYSGSAVVDVYKPPEVEGGTSTYKYYAVKYTRKDSGDFDFSETVEVKPVTTFQPTSSAPVTKAEGEPQATMPSDGAVAKFEDHWEAIPPTMWSGLI